MTLKRLRTDFKFAVISLFGAIAMVAIAPFAAFRFLRGEIAAGWVDVGILASIVLAVVHVWRGGSMRTASLFVVVATTFGCLWVALLLGLPGLLWMYPVLISHYLLLDRRVAAIVSVAAMGFLVWHGGAVRVRAATRDVLGQRRRGGAVCVRVRPAHRSPARAT